jgi:L-galactose dehydrogenase
VHDVEFGELNFIVSETIPALREIQRAGKARFIGITGRIAVPACRIGSG